MVSVTMREMLVAAARSASRSLQSWQTRSLMTFIWYSREDAVVTKAALKSTEVRMRRRKGEIHPFEAIAG